MPFARLLVEASSCLGMSSPIASNIPCQGPPSPSFPSSFSPSYPFAFSTDFKALSFKLCRPFPIFPASTLTYTTGTGVPATDVALRGPQTPAFTASLPTLSTASSVVTFDFGTYESTSIVTQNVDMLFSHTIGDFPEFDDKYTSLLPF